MARLPLLQSWLPSPEQGFHPAMASFSIRNGFFVLEADLHQPIAPVSTASAHGQRLWEQGDVVELFLQKEGEESYREYQVAPNGFTLALRYPDLTGVASVRSGERDLADYLTHEIPEVSVSFTKEGWRVLLIVPLNLKSGESFRVSCCRYDHSGGRAPVISSTSLYLVRDFHRPREWFQMIA